MRTKYLEDNLLKNAKEFNPCMHCQSKLYILEKQLYKIFKDEFREEERMQTIISLSKFNNQECGIPNTLLLDNRKDKNFMGLGMNFYKDFCELKEVFDSLSFKERQAFAIKIALLMEGFESEKYVYNDIHSRNILVKGTDIKLIDMDNGCFSSIIGNREYERLLNYSYMHLSQYILCLLFGIEVHPFSKIITKNLALFERNSNGKQMNIINSAMILEQDKLFRVSDFLESITQDYVEQIKPQLKICPTRGR